MYMYVYIYIYTHIRIYVFTYATYALLLHIGRGDDTVGNPHRAQISQFELLRS